MRASGIDLSFTPRRATTAYTEELDGECVILDEAGNRLHHLNASATIAWACFDGSGTLAEIAHDLANEFGTDPGATADDVLALAHELGHQGLLDGIDPDPDPDPGSAPGDEVQ